MEVDQKRAVGLMDQDQNMDIADIFRSIFTACDANDTNLVRVSDLIEFIKPYLMEDLNALEDLRHSLDPEDNNALVNSDTFYDAMSHWSQKVASASSSEDSEFNRSTTPNFLRIDDKDLPYTHSTPRASLGDKLLQSKDLLNLSNVSGYSLSTSRLENPTESDKTVLEEEIKKLEHQVLKTSNELSLTRQQLTDSEAQNDILHKDLARINRRLQEEQQVNETLQKNTTFSDELRDEVTNCRKNIEELKKKLAQSEKDSLFHKEQVNEIEREKSQVEKKLETLSKQHQDCLKKLFDVETELEAKEDRVNEISKVYKELEQNFSEQADLIKQLRDENDLLIDRKSNLEKQLKSKPSLTSPSSNPGNLLLDLSKSPSSFKTRHTNQPKCESVPLLKRVLCRLSSTPLQIGDEFTGGEGTGAQDSSTNATLLSPISAGDSFDGEDHRQDSSEEDLYWKLQGSELKLGLDINGATESLQTEMHRANPVPLNDSTYHTSMFERDERMAELEDEIDQLNGFIVKLEDQHNESLARLNKRNEELMENNFILRTNEESSVETLKQRIAHLERLGAIAEHDDDEHADAEVDEMRNRMRVLEATLKDKDLALGINAETVMSLDREVVELRAKLANLESLKDDFDERLQIAMRDLGEMAAEKLSLEEQVQKLQSQSLNCEAELNTTKEKLNTIELDRDEITRKDDQLEEILAEFQSKYRALEESEDSIVLLTSQNQQLQKDLDDANATKTELEVEVARFKTEHNSTIDELEGRMGNIDLVAGEIQNLIRNKNRVIEELKRLNRIFEVNLIAAHMDLKKKIAAIWEFKNELTKSLEIKNDLWKKAKTLEKDVHQKNCVINQHIENNRLLQEEYEVQKIEYNNLLIVYDLEVNKNSKLVRHVAKCTEEMDQYSNQCNKLNKELDKSVAKLTIENEKNLLLNAHILESDNKINNLESRIRELQEVHVSEVDRQDSTSQTIAENVLDTEDILSKIKSESDQLLEELETKLNQQVNKNRSLTKDLVEVQENLSRNNAELLGMKQKLADNEKEMVKKLQENCDKYDALSQELCRTKEVVKQKDIKLSKIEKELRETKETLDVEEDRIAMFCREVEDKNEQLQKYIEKYYELVEEFTKIEKELSETKEYLGVKEEKISKLSRELEDKNRQLQIKSETYNDLVKELNETKDKMDKTFMETTSKIESELNETKENLEVETEKRLGLSKELKESEEQIKELEEELKRAKHALKEATERDLSFNEELEEKNENLRTAQEMFETTQEHFEESFKHLEEELTRVNIELNKKQVELNKSKQECKIVKGALDLIQLENNQLIFELKQKLEGLQLEKQELIKNLAEANLMVGRQKEWLAAQETENKTLAEKNKDIENLNRKLQNEKDEIVQETKHAKERHNKELVLLKDSMQSNRTNERLQEELSKNKALFEQFSIMKTERDMLKFDAKEMDALLSNSQILSGKKRTELSDLQTKFDSQAAELVGLEKQLKQLQSELQTVTGQRDALNVEISKRSAELSRVVGLEKQLDELQSEMQKVTGQRDALNVEISKRSAELSRVVGLEKQLDELQSEMQKVTGQRDALNVEISKRPAELSKIEGLEKLLEQLQSELQKVTSQRDALNAEISRRPTSSGAKREHGSQRKTFSKQQITIDKLKDRIEELEGRLKVKVHKREADAETEKLIGEKKAVCEVLQARQEQLVILDERMKITKEELEDLNRELELKKQLFEENMRAKSTNEIGVQVDVDEQQERNGPGKSEGKTINKFTLASRPESPDSPSLGIEAIGLGNFKNAGCTKLYNIPIDSVLVIPSLDVQSFADDIIEELDLCDSSANKKKLDRDELQDKVTALTLRLIANANSISERIEQQTDRYRSQYEATVTLLGEISHRLRDHICIGTAEPIRPVFALLEEVKLQLRDLVQNASQVGVLAYEDRMKKCWNLVVNYVAMLRQDNEALHNITRETTPTQTGVIRKRNRFTQDTKPYPTEVVRQRRSRFGCCSKLSALLLGTVAFAIAVSLGINLNCRMTATDSQHCPFDGITQRINVGLPPM